MKKATIVGANQCGFLLAFGLQELGYEVSLFNRRSFEHIVGIRTRDVAFLSEQALEIEARLGLNFWTESVPYFDRAWLELKNEESRQSSLLNKSLQGYSGQIFDQRVKFARWADEFTKRGGEFTSKTLSPDELSAIAQKSLITLVPADNPLTQAVFERDEIRSREQGAAKKLVRILMRPLDPSANTMPGKHKTVLPHFLFLNNGEAVYSLPFRTPAGDECRSLVFDTVPGGHLEHFENARDANVALETARGILGQLSVAEALIPQLAEAIDPGSWEIMPLVPTIRNPVGVLPSGVEIMGVGDSFCPSDFIPGQYVNSTTHLADFLLRAIAGSDSSSFDAAWMHETFSGYWQSVAGAPKNNLAFRDYARH